VCIVGTGYVGLVTGAGLAKLGHSVMCVDNNHAKIDGLKHGVMPFFEADLVGLVQEGVYEGRLDFTTSFDDGIRDAQFVIVAVATPQMSSGDPDLSQLKVVITDLRQIAKQHLTVIVKSTVPIGAFKMIREMLKTQTAGQSSLALVACPEFLVEGTAVWDFFHPTRTIFGADTEQEARNVGVLFESIPGPRIYTTVETAVLIKYASNSFLASRIAFINEIAQIAERHGVDVHDVSRGILLDERFGKGYLTAGMGFGGACLPKDLAALTYTALQAGILHPILCEAITHQNSVQFTHSIELIESVLKGGNRRITVFGVSFKAGTSDVRSSIPVRVAKTLRDRGHTVIVTDPAALDFAHEELTNLGLICEANPWVAAKDSEAQLFLTGWPEYRLLDLRRLKQVVTRAAIFDGPGVLDPDSVRSAGFTYVGVGRINSSGHMRIQ